MNRRQSSLRKQKSNQAAKAEVDNAFASAMERLQNSVEDNDGLRNELEESIQNHALAIRSSSNNSLFHNVDMFDTPARRGDGGPGGVAGDRSSRNIMRGDIDSRNIDHPNGPMESRLVAHKKPSKSNSWDQGKNDFKMHDHMRIVANLMLKIVE